MVFGLGPVVRYELITTARRGRFYIARVVYGLCLLFLLFTRFQEFNAPHPRGDRRRGPDFRRGDVHFLRRAQVPRFCA